MTVWFEATVWCDRCEQDASHAKVEAQVVHGRVRVVLPPEWDVEPAIARHEVDVHICPKHPRARKVPLQPQRRR